MGEAEESKARAEEAEEAADTWAATRRTTAGTSITHFATMECSAVAARTADAATAVSPATAAGEWGREGEGGGRVMAATAAEKAAARSS